MLYQPKNIYCILKNIYLFLTLLLAASACSSDGVSNDSSNTISPGTPGKGGSTARFTLANGHLYTVDKRTLHVFSLNEPANPTKVARTDVNTWVETIFPRGNHLFIGTRFGMHIYDINTPATPKELSRVTHIYSCDPVVADDKYAYVTLRSVPNNCGRDINQLDVINIENLQKPVLKKTYPMSSPKGLGIDENLLYLCDDGLKVFDAQNPENLRLKQHFKIEADDVIPLEGHLIVVGADGLYQYRLEGEKLNLLSSILVEKPEK